MPITSSTFLNQVQVPATGSTPRPNTAPTSQLNRLGKQDFLKLLMAQMRNQDPMKPMDDTQMIAQMAQFSALEESQALRQVIQQSANVQAVNGTASLIGKYVMAKQADNSTLNGKVTGVRFETADGAVRPVIQVDGKDVDYSTINQISSSPITNG